MKIQGNRFVCLLLSCMLAMGMSACTGANDADALRENEKDKINQYKAADMEKNSDWNHLEGGTLKVMVCGNASHYMEKIAKKLQEAGFPYEVQIESTDETTALDEKVFWAHSAGHNYDIIQVNNSSVQMYVNADILEPLDEFVSGSELNIEENYSERLLEVGMIDGVSYAIPIAPDCRILAYNKKLLEAGGFEAPETMDEILEIAQALCNDEIYAFARRTDAPLGPAYIEGCFFAANDAHICEEVNGKLEATCNSKQMIECVKWWQQMMPYVPDDTNLNETGTRELFLQGKTLFYIIGPWDLPEFEGRMEYGTDYEFIVTPGREKKGSILGGWYIGIGKGSHNKEAAMIYMEELLRAENVTMMDVGLPADNRCYDMEPYNSEKYNMFREGFQIAEIPYPVTAQFNQIGKIFYDYFNKALLENRNAEEMMNACQAEIQDLLDKAVNESG